MAGRKTILVAMAARDLVKDEAQPIGMVQGGRLGDDESSCLDTPVPGFSLEIGSNGSIRKPDRHLIL